MTKQTDYTVEKVYDSPDKTTYYYVHSPEFNTEEEAEKLRQKIINNQKIVNFLIHIHKTTSNNSTKRLIEKWVGFAIKKDIKDIS